MGLFRKKKVKPQGDFDILSGDGLVSYVKANLKNPTEKNVAKAVKAIAEPDKDQTHLTKDGELPWGWLTQNTPLCEPYETKIVDMAVASKNMKLDDKIANLKKLIALYYEYKSFCYSKNECFIKYFADHWEHCYNSRCDDFEYIKPFEEELASLEANYEALIQEEQRKELLERSVVPHLRIDLLRMIEAEPGILQVAICKHYPADMKPYISNELYEMEQAGLIVKEKEGRLNKFFIK